LGFAVSGSAPTAAPAVEMTYRGMTVNGDVTHMTGLTIRVSGIRLSADEVDANRTTGDFVSRGNVLLHLEPIK